MRISILSENLQKKLSLLSHAVSSRSQMPILLHYLIEARNGEIIMSATDLEIGLQATLPADVDEEGLVVVPAKIFSDLIQSFGNEKITLQTTEKGLEIITGKTKSLLQTMQPDEFPQLYEEKGVEIARFSQEEMQNDFQKVVFAASLDTGRPALSGICIKPEEEGFLLVATDGYRLSLQHHKVSGEKNKDEKTVLIPARVFKEVLGIKNDSEVILYISHEKNQVLFSLGDMVVVGRLIDAEFPPYQKIIPNDHATQVSFDKSELQKAVRICSVFARESANIVKLSLQKTGMVISANTPSVGDNSVQIDAELKGEENDIAFNAKYILDVLGNIPDEQMVFEMTGPLNPGVFKIVGNTDFLHIIMPIRVQA